jgi:hypothetical protein
MMAGTSDMPILLIPEIVWRVNGPEEAQNAQMNGLL